MPRKSVPSCKEPLTEKHQEKMDKRLEKTKINKTPTPLDTKGKDFDN